MQGQQDALGVLEVHVDELLLGQLEAGDRLAELDPLVGVGQCRVEGGPGGAHRAPDDAVAGLVEAAERTLEAAHLGEARPTQAVGPRRGRARW